MFSSTRVVCVRPNVVPAAIIAIALIVSPGCRIDGPTAGDTTNGLEESIGVIPPGNDMPANMITGEVEIIFMGGRGQDPNEDVPAKRAFLSICAFEPTDTHPGHGSCVYSVTDSAGTVHRQITIELEGCRVDELQAKAWYRGVVVADSKGCGGMPGGGHTDSCAGDTGGCSDSTHDHTEGGCMDTGHDDGHDGGCSGHSGMAEPGGPRVSGRSCRVGQLFIGKAHDGGTPGIRGDGVTWKWFDAGAPDVPVLGDLSTWQHLCGKTIIGGNLVVHTGAPGRDVNLRQ